MQVIIGCREQTHLPGHTANGSTLASPGFCVSAKRIPGAAGSPGHAMSVFSLSDQSAGWSCGAASETSCKTTQGERGTCKAGAQAVSTRRRPENTQQRKRRLV